MEKPRKPLLVGNWKMNKTVAEAVALAEPIATALGKETGVQVVLCPPFTALASVGKMLENGNVQLGAQNMNSNDAGAYTGEIAPSMLRDLFVTFVILGHSERRALFHETDAFINQKVLACFENNLKPILCVGETLAEREAGKTLEVVLSQFEKGVAGLDTVKAESLVLAYEPVWAIGTGRNASPEQAQEVHAALRKALIHLWGPVVAHKIRILYGGSLKPDNAASLFQQADIDGGLVGGASLDARSFLKLIDRSISSNSGYNKVL